MTHRSDGTPISDVCEALDMAIEALKADVVSREEAIQAVDKCRERKNKEIEQLREFYSQKPTIPMFAESAEAYKAWTGEEMGKTHGRLIDVDALLDKLPKEYLGSTVHLLINNAPTVSADRPHGEWIEMGENEDGTHNIKCNQCGQGYQTRGHAHSLNTREKYKFCPSCGAKMGGDGE